MAPTADLTPLEYKQLVIRWSGEAYNRQRAEVIDEMMAPDCLVEVEGSDQPLGPNEFRHYLRAFLMAVPDINVETMWVVTEGTRSVQAWRARGTHLGPGLGIPPTGRKLDFTGLTSYEFRERSIIHGADRWNRGEMLASLLQPRIGEVTPNARLTAREAQVALLIAERYPHAEIAKQLAISPNTARRHAERVLKKLGVNRRQDVAKALGKIPGSALARQGVDLAP